MGAINSQRKLWRFVESSRVAWVNVLELDGYTSVYSDQNALKRDILYRMELTRFLKSL